MSHSATPINSPIITIHYHRGDGDYREAGLWIWDGTGEKLFRPHEIHATASDDFGIVFVLDVDALTAGTAPGQRRIGFIPRIHKSWSFKDGHDRFWQPSHGQEIWLVEEDERIHKSPPRVDPCILCAFLDEPDRILTHLSHPAPRELLNPSHIEVRTREGMTIPIREIRVHGQAERIRRFDILLQEPVDRVNNIMEVRLHGYREAVVLPRNAMMDPARYYTREPLGALYASNATTFRYFSPGATSLTVMIYRNASDLDPVRKLALTQVDGGTWEGHADGDLDGMHYSLHVASALKPEGEEFIDPHAINSIGNAKRARITNVRATDPDHFRPIVRLSSIEKPTDAVIYEVHVRDFTISPDSGAQRKGTYSGFAEARTHHPEDAFCKTGLEHLRELGVTHVQLLPVQDFDNEEINPEYNWGYMTAFFNSPEGWYATDIQGTARIRELKLLIRSLHELGIGVIMDVVYNHTGDMNTLENLAPRYYHRFRDNGTKHNGSGTGNEFRSEAPMGRRFIVDSCLYWMKEYGVNGFRFDLMGLIDIETMKAVREELHKIDPNVLLYGEPWTGGEAGIHDITDKWAIRGTGIAAFNDHFRNALKGDPDGHNPGYVQTGHDRDAIIRGISGSIDDWAGNPADTINYATCHDNLTLWDKIELSCSESEEERIKMQMLTFGILAVSQGILFLHGGEEFCRTKFGNENSYKSGDKINQFRWGLKRRYRPVFDFHKGMIALRRLHPLFRLASSEEVRKRLQFHYQDLPCHEAIFFTLDGNGLTGENWKQALVFINPTHEEKMFRVPGEHPIHIFARGEKAMTEPFDQVVDTVRVPGRGLVLGARL